MPHTRRARAPVALPARGKTRALRTTPRGRRALLACLLALTTGAPLAAHAQAPPDAEPHVFVRTRAVIDAHSIRDAAGRAHEVRRFEQRTDLVVLSRTSPDVRAYSSFGYRFDRGLARDASHPLFEGEQLEPTLYRAFVRVADRDARLDAGRIPLSSPLGAATVDGVVGAYAPSVGPHLLAAAGIRPDPRRGGWRRTHHELEGPLEREAPVHPTRFTEVQLGYVERRAALRLALRDEEETRADHGQRIGASARLGSIVGTHLNANVLASSLSARVDDARVSLIVPQGAHHWSHGLRYHRGWFPADSSWWAYPISGRADAWSRASLRVSAPLRLDVEAHARRWTESARGWGHASSAAAGGALALHADAAQRTRIVGEVRGSHGDRASELRAGVRAAVDLRRGWNLSAAQTLSAWRDPGREHEGLGTSAHLGARYDVDQRARFHVSALFGNTDRVGLTARVMATAELALPGASW